MPKIVATENQTSGKLPENLLKPGIISLMPKFIKYGQELKNDMGDFANSGAFDNRDNPADAEAFLMMGNFNYPKELLMRDTGLDEENHFMTFGAGSEEGIHSLLNKLFSRDLEFALAGLAAAVVALGLGEDEEFKDMIRRKLHEVEARKHARETEEQEISTQQIPVNPESF